jgi:hypothetical protein
MATTFALLRLRCGWVGALLVGGVLLTCVGCQTFSLSSKDFQKQQRGEMVDPETGEVVGIVGTVGYFGAIIGEAVAGAGRK